MKISELLLIVLVKTINAKINLDISAGNGKDIAISFSGEDLKVVSDHEIEQFGIDDDTLAGALKTHYGRKASNFFLKSPTPWGDLYKIYKWDQVMRVLTVKSASVKSIVKQPVIFTSQDFDNYSNQTIKVNTGMSQSVENTVTTSWTRNTEIIVSQEVEYGLNVIFAKATGTTGFSFSTSWGQSEDKSETIIVGSTAGVETELKPGQAVTAVLSANRGYLEIEVVYAAKLRGYMAVNFRKKLRGHHFWFPPIENVMKSGGLTNERTAVEIIKIGYYSEASLKVYDKETGLPV